jgi:hypothetical protein
MELKGEEAFGNTRPTLCLKKNIKNDGGLHYLRFFMILEN